MASGKLIMQFASSTALIGREKGATQPDTQTSASSIWIRRAEKTPSASITMGAPSTQPLPPLHEMLAGETRLPRFEDLLTSASTPRKPPTSSHSADLPIKQGEPSASGHSTDARETTLPLQTSKNATPSSESNSISGESSFARATSEESNRVIPAKRLLQRWNSRPLLQQNSLRPLWQCNLNPPTCQKSGGFHQHGIPQKTWSSFKAAGTRRSPAVFHFPLPHCLPECNPERTHLMKTTRFLAGPPSFFDHKESQALKTGDLEAGATGGCGIGEGVFQGKAEKRARIGLRRDLRRGSWHRFETRFAVRLHGPEKCGGRARQRRPTQPTSPNATGIARANGAHVRHSAETRCTP